MSTRSLDSYAAEADELRELLIEFFEYAHRLYRFEEDNPGLAYRITDTLELTEEEKKERY